MSRGFLLATFMLVHVHFHWLRNQDLCNGKRWHSPTLFLIFCGRSSGSSLQDDNPQLNHPRLYLELLAAHNDYRVMAKILYLPLKLLLSVHLCIALLTMNWNVGAVTIRDLIMYLSREDESDFETTDCGSTKLVSKGWSGQWQRSSGISKFAGRPRSYQSRPLKYLLR